jgi:xylose isomerase
MAVDYKKKIGFKGQFYIEPKPREPSTHQYDSDAAACLNFLREYGLLEHFQLNIETNHATIFATNVTSTGTHQFQQHFTVTQTLDKALGA